jgi:hypothetical protein
MADGRWQMVNGKERSFEVPAQMKRGMPAQTTLFTIYHLPLTIRAAKQRGR